MPAVWKMCVDLQCEKDIVLPESWSFALLPLTPGLARPALRPLGHVGSTQEAEARAWPGQRLLLPLGARLGSAGRINGREASFSLLSVFSAVSSTSGSIMIFLVPEVLVLPEEVGLRTQWREGTRWQHCRGPPWTPGELLQIQDCLPSRRRPPDTLGKEACLRLSGVAVHFSSWF